MPRPATLALLISLLAHPAPLSAAPPAGAAGDLASQMRAFKLPAPTTATTPQSIWMTNYNRTPTALLGAGQGVALLDRGGQPLKEGGNVPVVVDRRAFCLGADNSVLAVSGPGGTRVFATTGPIGKRTADCTDIFSHGLAPPIIDTINRQSFADVTGCAPFGLDASEHALVPYRSIAVKQGGAIPIGTVLYVPRLSGLRVGPARGSLFHDGYVVAVDHVDSGKARPGLPEALHVDVFIGDQGDLLSSAPVGGDLSFRLMTVQVVRDPALKAVLLDRPSCPVAQRPASLPH